MIEVRAVNVATPTVLTTQDGESVWSAIAKAPVVASATMWLSLLNLAGDGQADLTVHGGVDKAVYAYPSEHLEPWRDELGEELGVAPFGENLSTFGVLETDVRIGDVWAWGEAVLQIAQPRWPCFKLALHRRRPDIQAKMRAAGRTGWYLRVLQPGAVPASGPITVAGLDPANVTIADAHLAMADVRVQDRQRVTDVAAHAALAEEWRGPLQRRLERHA